MLIFRSSSRISWHVGFHLVANLHDLAATPLRLAAAAERPAAERADGAALAGAARRPLPARLLVGAVLGPVVAHEPGLLTHGLDLPRAGVDEPVVDPVACKKERWAFRQKPKAIMEYSKLTT